MGALRERMDKDMVLRGMAERTRESYLYAVRELATHYRRSSNRISEREVLDYLLHMIQERKLASSSCNIAANGLRFLYHVTLKRPEASFSIPRRRSSQAAASESVPPASTCLILSHYRSISCPSDVRRVRSQDRNRSGHAIRPTARVDAISTEFTSLIKTMKESMISIQSGGKFSAYEDVLFAHSLH